MAQGPVSEATERSRIPWGLVKVLFAVGVLFLVARIVPWRDKLTWSADDGEVALAGTIVGDWTGERIAFEVDAQALAGEDVPESLRAACAGGAALELERGERAEWRPGMPTVFGSMNPLGLIVGLLLFPMGVLFTATRWWRLLIAAGCPTTLFTSVRLTFLGMFFNLVMPGLTGGDLVKAVLAAREHTERKARAVVSVAVDRLIGLFPLATLAALVVLGLGDTFAAIRVPVLVCVGGGLVGAAVYSSRALRRLVRFDHIVSKLPGGRMIKQVDEAVLIYSEHPREIGWALLCSLGNHTCVFVGITVLARSFGEQTLSLFEMFAVVSIANIVSALPVAPAGWGVGEAAYGFLFDMLGASATLGIATSITLRLLMMVIGLGGGLFLLLPGGKDALREARS